MITVNEVSKLTGVSIRTLHYYDEIHLLKPTKITESGYRLYDEDSLERLQQILLFRELEFPLKEIKQILDSPGFDRQKALEQQIELLTLKKEHLENLILFARGIHGIGVRTIDFSAFDTKKLDEYAKKAKETWQHTDAYKEFEEKDKKRGKEDNKALMKELMDIFVDFGKMKDLDPASEEAQTQVRVLQTYITEHFYKCTPQILSGLGQMYACGGEFTENIDAAGGEGTAEFVNRAIQVYTQS